MARGRRAIFERHQSERFEQPLKDRVAPSVSVTETAASMGVGELL
jgi:hypothetical protein